MALPARCRGRWVPAGHSRLFDGLVSRVPPLEGELQRRRRDCARIGNRLAALRPSPHLFWWSLGIEGLAMDVLAGSGPGRSVGSRCNGLVNRCPAHGDLARSGRARVVDKSSGIRTVCFVRNRKSYLRSGGAPAEDMGPIGPLHLLLASALRDAPLVAADRK